MRTFSRGTARRTRALRPRRRVPPRMRILSAAMARRVPPTDPVPMNTAVSTLPRLLPALRGNLLVGLTLAVVTLPQAIAFSTMLAGLPPHFGIYAAVWGVLFTAALNPSRVFSGGPNTTMSAAIGVTLLPLAPPFGADYIGYALTLILLAGLVQLLFLLIRPL